MAFFPTREAGTIDQPAAAPAPPVPPPPQVVVPADYDFDAVLGKTLSYLVQNHPKTENLRGLILARTKQWVPEDVEDIAAFIATTIPSPRKAPPPPAQQPAPAAARPRAGEMIEIRVEEVATERGTANYRVDVVRQGRYRETLQNFDDNMADMVAEYRRSNTNHSIDDYLFDELNQMVIDNYEYDGSDDDYGDYSYEDHERDDIDADESTPNRVQLRQQIAAFWERHPELRQQVTTQAEPAPEAEDFDVDEDDDEDNDDDFDDDNDDEEDDDEDLDEVVVNQPSTEERWLITEGRIVTRTDLDDMIHEELSQISNDIVPPSHRGCGCDSCLRDSVMQFAQRV